MGDSNSKNIESLPSQEAQPSLSSQEKKTTTIIREDSFITMDNLNDLNEEEVLILLDKWKNQHLPTGRFYAFTAYNFAMCGLTMYYTWNFKTFSKKYIKPKAYDIKTIFKYGTLFSATFLTVYFLGAACVSGFWHPFDYIRGYAKIQGRIIDNTLKYDPYVQNYLLYDMMKYFGLSPNLMQQAQKELDQQQKELEDKDFFSSQTKDLIRQSQKDYDDLQAHKAKLAAEKEQLN